MKSIIGRINLNNKSIQKELFEKAADMLLVNANTTKVSKFYSHAGFAQISFNSSQSFIIKNSNQIVVADSRLDNKEELCKLLEIENEVISDDELILKVYERWAEDCPEYLRGDFAFAIWDETKQELLCARDHFGLKSLYYYIDENCFIFSSELNAILTQTDLKFTLDEQYLADSISIVKSEKFRTLYQEIKKLPPASALKFKNSDVTIRAYWNLQNSKPIDLSDEEIMKQFKLHLQEAVKCRVQNLDFVGAELSGGIDSSSIAALAKQFKSVKTFSHVLPDEKLGIIKPFKDEREFQNLLIEFCQINERHRVYSDEIGLIETLKQNINDFNYISQQNFSTFSDQLYKKANKDGVNVLLSGFGGDEVVTSKASGYLNELARLGLWKELKTDLKNQKLSRILINKRLFTYWFKFITPRFYKFLSKLRNQKPWWLSKFDNLALNEDYSERLKIKERYFTYYNKPDFETINDKCIERITHPHVSQRLEYCSQAAKKHGIEYRYPLLDKRLIEFYLSMPSHLKAKNGVGRLAIRKAMEGLLPKKIQWRNDKTGATIPTVYMRFLMDKEEIAELIKKAKSNKTIQKYIDLEKYEQWYTKQVVGEIENPGAFYNYLKLILFIEKNPSLFE